MNEGSHGKRRQKNQPVPVESPGQPRAFSVRHRQVKVGAERGEHLSKPGMSAGQAPIASQITHEISNGHRWWYSADSKRSDATGRPVPGNIQRFRLAVKREAKNAGA